MTPSEVSESLSQGSREYFSEEEIQEAKERKRAIRVSIHDFFETPEQRDPLVLGLEKAMDLLTPDIYVPLALRYGLDNPQNKGRTLKEVGKLLPNQTTGKNSITGERARQKIVKAERRLRHPARAKYYRDFLPKLQFDSG